jgi:DNA (cytosine-5)-methyltransferase 1
MSLTFGSLFAGIGGFDLGFERAGMRCEWQVEIDPYCQRVLAKHWPNVRRWDDVRTFPPAGDWGVDVICGGPPCQPASNAGMRLGLSDERWFWPDTIRIIRTLRPRFAVLENPPAILALDGGRAFDGILGALADCGFDAEWDVLPASDFGTDHRRERLFLVAYPVCERSQIVLRGVPPALSEAFGWGERHTDSFDSHSGRLLSMEQRFSEPCLLRANDGIPDWPRALKPLGNAVVPQVAEWIGRRIVEASL